MVEMVDGYVREAADEPDAWLGLTRALQKVCEVQAFDRGLREVMLGTGRGPERQQQMRERVGPRVDAIVARAQDQGTLRADIVPADFPVLQLMLGAVSDHIGQPGLWRRYLAIIVDGLRARPGEESPLPDVPVSDDALQKAILDSSARSIGDRGANRGGRGRQEAVDLASAVAQRAG